MIKLTAFKDKKIALFGLGISGLASLKSLKEGGAQVFAWDDGELGRKRAQEAGFTLTNLAQLPDEKWQSFNYLVLAPGVPLTHPKPHPLVLKAQQSNTAIIGDVELFCQQKTFEQSDDKIIAITGTNGKSTTTALTTHLLNESGFDAVVGGNIGTAVCDLPPFGSGKSYVLELSSYQLDLTPSIQLDAAALLNITPDHLDRHGSLEHYAAVKAKIFRNMHQDQPARSETSTDKVIDFKHHQTGIVGIDDALSKQISDKLDDKIQLFRVKAERDIAGEIPFKQGILYRPGALLIIDDGKGVRTIDFAAAPSLRGAHNGQNAAVAFLLAKALGAKEEKLAKALISFQALAHRMQNIRQMGDVLFVNDSKATNSEAARQSLSAFQTIYWLAGGEGKKGGIEELAPHLGAVRCAFLFGRDGKLFAKTLEKQGIKTKIFERLEEAVIAARDYAIADEGVTDKTILLAPAAASFDQYRSFEARGDDFIKIVEALV